MKFSEHIVLGSTLVKFKSCVFLQEGCGCLIGMAGASLGETDLGGRASADRITELFPWLTKMRVVRCPVCSVTQYSYCESVSCVAYHVEVGEMTFEQALDYIRSIEPADEFPNQEVPVWNRYHGVGA